MKLKNQIKKMVLIPLSISVISLSGCSSITFDDVAIAAIAILGAAAVVYAIDSASDVEPTNTDNRGSTDHHSHGHEKGRGAH